jgi:methyltransferase (TIGR00027 family)
MTMVTKRASDTAESAAATRALESFRAKRERLIHDPYAHWFLRPKNRLLVELTRWSPLRQMVTRHYDRVFPGVMGEFILRTHFIDEQLVHSLQRGRSRITQVVIIGAGFDARALRLREVLLADFFEIDHPATQQRKNQVMLHRRTYTPNVRYVPLDLTSQSLLVLNQHGFDPAQPAFFIVEGLLYYLPECRALELLRSISAIAALGSRVVFNFLDASFLPNAPRAQETGRIHEHVREVGEPFLFALDVAKLEEFLGSVGLHLVEHMRTTSFVSQAGLDRNFPYVLNDMFQSVVAEPLPKPSPRGSESNGA